MDYSLPGFSVHGIFQARILEWVAIPFSRGIFRTWVSCIGSRILCGLSDQGSSRQNKWGKRLLKISTDGQILAFFLLSTLSYIWKETFIFWWFYRVTWPLNCRPSSNTLGSHNTSHPQNCFHPPLNSHHHSMLHISHWTCPIFFSCIFCASFFAKTKNSWRYHTQICT